MTQPGGYLAGDVLTAANLNLLPGGHYGQAYTGSSQTGIGSSATDLTSLSATVNTVATRRYRILGMVNFRQRTAGSLVTIEIVRGSTVLSSAAASYNTDEYGTLTLFFSEVPGAGSNTYKLRAKTSSGTVDINPQGLSTVPSGIIVEDIGN